MPIAPPRGADRSAVIIGLISIAGLAMTVFLASRILGLASDGDLQVSADRQKFEVGDAEQWAIDISDRGPVFFPDASNRDRDIFVQHLGDDPDTGWLAFGVRPVEAPRECFVEWMPADDQFVDKCDGTEYDSAGTGLPQYGVAVDADGRLVVDINSAFRDDPTDRED